VTIEPLSSHHNRAQFFCEEETLTKYFREQVGQDVKRKLAVCFVLTGENAKVFGYYTLSSESIPRYQIPDKYKKKIPKSYRAPVFLLGRLARDLATKGKGIGEILLVDALFRCLALSEKSIGSIAVVVDPINDYAIKFYSKYGFLPLYDSARMFIPMRTIKSLSDRFE